MKKIAVIGGSYLQLPVVKMAQSLGYEVHCFAWAEGAVCKNVADYFYPISIIEKDQILEVCKNIKIDGVVTIASDVAVLTVNYIAKAMNLIANDDAYSKITTNKYLMRQCFAQNAVPSPKYRLAKISDEHVDEGMKYPLIVKPTDRSGSRGVEKINNPQELYQAIKRACGESFGNEAIVEEFVPGLEISVESISWKGKHYILQITDKVTTEAPYFVELEHHQPSILSDEIKNKVKNIVLNALDALHIEYGASHSELKITPQGDAYVVEIGARMGGDFIGSDLVRLSTGYDFLKGVVQVAMGEFEIPIFKEQKCSGVYFLSEETKYIKSIIENYKQYPEIVQAEITNPDLKKIECSGDRCGYFIYQSEKRLKI